MGKKSQEKSKPESQSALQSLFSGDNPFRRRSHTETASTPEADVDSGERRKRKEEKRSRNPDPSSTPDSLGEKRKKIENVEGGAGAGEGDGRKEKRKKRKRDEIEAEYERRRLGEAPEVAGAEEEGGRIVMVGEKRKAADLALEESATEPVESFDDESKLVRTVFVGNLPLKTKKKALLKEFCGFGEIESVRIRSVPIVDTKTPRKGAIIQGKLNDAVDSVHAYIVFKDEKSAQSAISHNMAQFGGNHIRVDMACPPRKKLKGEGPLYDRKRTVFVGNLPFDVKDEEIYQLFCGVSETASSVEAARVIRDPNTSLGKGIAYVLFKSRDAANTIVKKRDLKIRDRVLRVCHAKKSSDATPTPSKRKAVGAKWEFPKKKFAESAGEMFGNSDHPKARAPNLSYQGVRTSKSGVVKKSASGTIAHSAKQGSYKSKRSAKDKKIQTTKRPAVAARKAKQLVKKRKQESATPENTHRNKKRKFA